MKLLALLLLLGCSQLTEEQCDSMDWYQKGIEDAVTRDYDQKHLEYKETCAAHGIEVNSKHYKDGYNKGLEKYCTDKTAFDLGMRGEEIHQGCLEVNKKFQAKYDSGYKEYLHNLDKEELEDKLRQSVIDKHGGFECSDSSECVKEMQCLENKCSHNGKACEYNSDCEVSGRCEDVVKFTRYDDDIRVKVCTYKKPKKK